MKYKELEQLKIHASDCQLAADEIAFTLIEERKFNKKMNMFQDYCNFNVHQTIGRCKFYLDAVDFINRNGKELKRKFELGEFLKFGMELRIKKMAFKIETFKQFKDIEIKGKKIKTKSKLLQGQKSVKQLKRYKIN